MCVARHRHYYINDIRRVYCTWKPNTCRAYTWIDDVSAVLLLLLFYLFMGISSSFSVSKCFEPRVIWVTHAFTLIAVDHLNNAGYEMKQHAPQTTIYDCLYLQNDVYDNNQKKKAIPDFILGKRHLKWAQSINDVYSIDRHSVSWRVCVRHLLALWSIGLSAKKLCAILIA